MLATCHVSVIGCFEYGTALRCGLPPCAAENVGHINVNTQSVGHINVNPQSVGHINVNPQSVGYINVNPQSAGHINVNPPNVKLWYTAWLQGWSELVSN